MPRFFKLLLILPAIFAALASASVATVYLRPGLAKPWLERALAPAGGDLRLGEFRVSGWPLVAEIDNIELSHPAAGLRLTAKRAKFHLAGIGGLLKAWPLARAELVSPRLESRPPAWPMDSGAAADLAPLARLAALGALRVRDGRALVRLPGVDIILRDFALAALPQPRPQEAAITISGVLNAQNTGGAPLGRAQIKGNFQLSAGPLLSGSLVLGPGIWNLPWARGELSGRAVISANQKELRLTEALLQARGLQTGPALGFRWREEKLALSLAGIWGWGSGQWRLDKLALHGARLVSLKGRLWGGPTGLAGGQVQGEIPSAGQFLAANGWWQGLSGSVPFDFKAGQGGELSASLDSLTLALPGYPAPVGLVGQFRARPRGNGLAIKLAARVERPALSLAGDFSLSRPGGLSCQNLSLNLPGTGRLAGKLALGQGQGEVLLTGQGLSLAGLARLAPKAAPGLRLSGRAGLRLSARLAGPGGKLLALMDLADAGFSLAPGDLAGEKLAGRVGAELILGQGPPRLKAEVSLARGAALINTVLLDFAATPLKARAEFSLPLANTPQPASLSLGLAGLGSLDWRGSLAWPGGGLPRHVGHLRLSGVNLATAFAKLVREPFADSVPGLDQIKIAGQAELKLRARGDGEQLKVAGRLNLQDVSARDPKMGWAVRGMDLDLPLSYNFWLGKGAAPRKAPPAPPREWGRLVARRVSLPGGAAAGLSLPLALVPGRLYSRGAISAPFWGGRVTLDQLRVDAPLSPGFRARLRARLAGLDLAKSGLLAGRLSGGLQGELTPIVVTKARLTAGGHIKGRVFGGNLMLSGIGLNRPLNPDRDLSAQVAIKGLHLDQLSRATNIGNITGRLDVSLRDMMISRGEPIGFYLRAQSVPAKGVSQRVSLKAVNSISVMGTGSGISGVGLSLMSAFLSDFPYQKIGFSLRLENDVFTVRGLIREGGLEYLVQKPLFIGINVINRNQNNRISFDDMKERVKRVTGPPQATKPETADKESK